MGIDLMQSWGMTELTPLGSSAVPKSYMDEWSKADRNKVRATQGLPIPYTEARAVNEEGVEVPWDGKSMGELQVKGCSVISGYYKDDRSEGSFQDGWFKTGDVVVITPEGYIQIVDRTKDLVKSGGEWISSVELENEIMAHPEVAEAAVIAMPHDRWQERPMACVVPKEGVEERLLRDSIMSFLEDRVAKWWLPDEVVFIESVPRTSVGKFDKKALRKQVL